MRMSLFCVGVLFCLAMLMGADAKSTRVQSEVADILRDKLGLELEPADGQGGDQAYKVTDEAIEKLNALKKDETPIEVPSTDEEIASAKRNALKAMGFVQKKDGMIGSTKHDVTDATIEKLKGKTIIVNSKGKVTLK